MIHCDGNGLAIFARILAYRRSGGYTVEVVTAELGPVQSTPSQKPQGLLQKCGRGAMRCQASLVV